MFYSALLNIPCTLFHPSGPQYFISSFFHVSYILFHSSGSQCFISSFFHVSYILFHSSGSQYFISSFSPLSLHFISFQWLPIFYFLFFSSFPALYFIPVAPNILFPLFLIFPLCCILFFIFTHLYKYSNPL